MLGPGGSAPGADGGVFGGVTPDGSWGSGSARAMARGRLSTSTISDQWARWCPSGWGGPGLGLQTGCPSGPVVTATRLADSSSLRSLPSR